MFNVTTVLPHNLLQTNPCIRYNFSTQVFRKRAAQLYYVGPELCYISWPPLEARKCSAARGCEAKRWSHWTCSSLGTIFKPVRINSVPGVKCFSNNKNVLRAQSMVWHFVHHPVHFWYFVNSWTYTFYVENSLWVMWLYYWSQLIASTDTPLYSLRTYNLKFNCV